MKKQRSDAEKDKLIEEGKRTKSMRLLGKIIETYRISIFSGIKNHKYKHWNIWWNCVETK